eukprot:1724817-Prymnesium_polylepis.1
MFALTPPIASEGPAADRRASTAAANEPASIGSPSAVPVPCASLSRSPSGETDASVSAPASSPCWACPLGAVRLALRPSCRTALPQTSSPSGASATRCWSTSPPHASPRA